MLFDLHISLIWLSNIVLNLLCYIYFDFDFRLIHSIGDWCQTSACKVAKTAACWSAFTHPAIQIQHQKMNSLANADIHAWFSYKKTPHPFYCLLNTSQCKYNVGFFIWLPQSLYSRQYLKLKNWNRAGVSCSRQQCQRLPTLWCEQPKIKYAVAATWCFSGLMMDLNGRSSFAKSTGINHEVILSMHLIWQLQNCRNRCLRVVIYCLFGNKNFSFDLLNMHAL